MDELVIDNLVYIPSKRAAAITGYAKDYIGQLCREGRIEAKLVGRSWYVLESSVREHRFGKPGSQAPVEVGPATASSVEDVQAQAEEAPIAEAATREEPLSTWESPLYTAEPVKELIGSDHPTSLENTTPHAEPAAPATQIEEVQSAWQEWFAKNEQAKPEPVALAAEEEQIEMPAEDDTVQEEEREEVVEEEEIPVRVIRSYPGSMDIQPEAQPVAVIRARVPEPRVLEERVVRRYKTPASSRLALKAVFIGIMIIVGAVTVIGTGSLDALSPSWASKSPPIDFLAGVKSVEK
jgi:hypothetical protein